MKIRTLDIGGPLLIEPKRSHDIRGFSCEVYNADKLAEHGVNAIFTQDNVSLSTASGTISGLHFQSPPHAQHKLIKVVRGAIFCVAVDIRIGSPSFAKHVSVELSGENGHQLYIPPGFAHGLATLRPLTEIGCKVSMPHSPEHDLGLYWDDPSLRIGWPVAADEAIISPRDEAWPLLRETTSPFHYKSAENGVAA